MNNPSNSSNKLELQHWISLIPAILLLGLTPIFIKFFQVNYPAIPVNWKLDPYTVGDIFSYGKMHLILVAGLLSTVYIYFKLNFKALKGKQNKPLIFVLGGVVVWLLLTTITAKFPHAALWGMIEKYEGVFVWLSYIAFGLYIASIASDKLLSKWVLRIILLSGLIVTGIGLTQFLSHDIIKMKWFMALIIPKELIDSTSFAFEVNRVYTTLYNPNFVAMYVATLMPLSLYMILEEVKTPLKALWAVFSVLLLINLIGAKSSGGFGGLAIAAVGLIAIFVVSKLSIKNKPQFATLGFTALILLFIVFSVGLLAPLMTKGQFSSPYGLKSISTEGYQVKIDYNGKILLAETPPETLNMVTMYTGDHIQLGVTSLDGESYSINSPDFKNITFSTGLSENGLAYVNFSIDGVNWVFLLHPDGMLYVNSMSTTVPIEASKGSGGFNGHENFGSARGFIWSRTMPLITASPIVGYGADNYGLVFPQNDYNIKYQLYGTPNILIDKAHNYYLQLATSFGIPGMILVLSLILLSVKNLLTEFYSQKPNARLYLVFVLCILGYLGSGLFYDSNVHVSPFFWTFIGFGLKDLFSLSKA